LAIVRCTHAYSDLCAGRHDDALCESFKIDRQKVAHLVGARDRIGPLLVETSICVDVIVSRLICSVLHT
jgi:hypothetical protein